MTMGSNHDSAVSVSDVHAFPTSVTSIYRDGYRLLRDIPVVVEEHPDSVSVSWLEVGVSGVGVSISEALRQFEEDLVYLYDDLASSGDSELGPEPRRWKAILSQMIIRE